MYPVSCALPAVVLFNIGVVITYLKLGQKNVELWYSYCNSFNAVMRYLVYCSRLQACDEYVLMQNCRCRVIGCLMSLRLHWQTPCKRGCIGIARTTFCLQKSFSFFSPSKHGPFDDRASLAHGQRQLTPL